MPGLEIVIVVLSGLSLTLLQLRERPVLSLAAALVLVGAPALGGIVAFARAGVLFDPVLPTLTALGGVPARHHHRLPRQGTRAPRHPRALRLFPAARADRRGSRPIPRPP
jgi:CHASE2 domain-containing sensor protein